MTSVAAAVRVPASTSNLGGGFDCVGMAVDRWLSASVLVDPAISTITMARRGSVAAVTCAVMDDLVYEGFAAACRACERPVPAGLAFDVSSDIPVARGLGSSAAALVAGAALADAALSLHLGPEGVATLVSQIEGHPDNAAPAVFGGAMLGVARDDALPGQPCTYAFAALSVHPSLSFVFAVPPLEVTTAAARAVLPATVSFQDAVSAVQRSAALIHGLSTGNADLLSRALDDVLHVPYRKALIPGYTNVVNAACAAGAFGGTLSGSGSAMVAIGRHADAVAIAAAMRARFADHRLEADTIITASGVGGFRLERPALHSPETSPPLPS